MYIFYIYAYYIYRIYYIGYIRTNMYIWNICIYGELLNHTIMEAEKSHNLLSAS